MAESNGHSSIQLLFTFFVLLLCLKPTHSCVGREGQALLKIKEGLIDEYGHLSSWSSEEGKRDCCKWRGVRCNNQTGHVIQLDLNFSRLERLRGKLSPFLTELHSLSYLDVSFNDFNQSPIPDSIGSLSNLRHLDLNSAGFGRKIPHQLGNLSSLQYLDLSGNYFTETDNLGWLTQLSSLKYLDMSFVDLSKFDNWPQVVYKLPSLKFLGLTACNLSNIFSVRFLNSSTSLDVLALSLNGFTSSSVLELLFNSNISIVELHLLGNQFHGLIPDAFCKINSLEHLNLNFNDFEGGIPKTFGSMCNLKFLFLAGNNLNGQLRSLIHNFTGCANLSMEWLVLDQNQIMGSLPDLSAFPSLGVLSLNDNRLTGKVPESLGNQSKLESLSLGGNSLEGVISETHFSKLTKLKVLDLSNLSLVFNFRSDWVPPFQLNGIYLWSCQLGGQFPKWLQTQKNYFWLDIADSGISDTISNSYWIFSSRLVYMNLSYNQISGHIPYFSMEFSSVPLIDLSSNKLEGEIPSFLFKAAHLDLSKNMFSKPLVSLCEAGNGNLEFLDLSNNQLSGQLPDCWMHFEKLKILKLANNRFHGKIPSSVGTLLGMETLDLGNNNFSGELPSSLKSCRELKLVSLRANDLSGQIPTWLGSNHPNLVVLILQSNHFYGSIPSHLCNLTHLQLLDLSINHISGSIPKCLKNITSLTQKFSPNSTITHKYEGFIFSDYHGMSVTYDDNAIWMWKGREFGYKKNLGRIKSIDLSSNKLTGAIPNEIMELVGLISLNLSRNLLTGRITSKIGVLQSLEVLDLSENRLCGEIPSSISLINSLNFLNLSNNYLSGKIPTGPQLNTFTASAYEGNFNLCGFPLPKKCFGEDTAQNPVMIRGSGSLKEEEDGFLTLGFYVSAAFGFVVSFWGVIGTFILKWSWRFSNFKFLNNFKDKLYVTQEH